jgi:hypothetical protein
MQSRLRERLIALFLLGTALFSPPLLFLFDKPIRVIGLPILYLYLFLAWGLLIALVALAGKVSDSGAEGDGAAVGEPSAEAQGADAP